MKFTAKENEAVISMAYHVILSDGVIHQDEQSAFATLQSKLDCKLPENPMSFEECADALKGQDDVTKLRVLLTMQDFVLADGELAKEEKNCLTKLIGLLGLQIKTEDEGIATVLRLASTIKSLDIESVKALDICQFIPSDKLADLIAKSNDITVESAIAKIARMEESDKCIVGFALQQLASLDGVLDAAEKGKLEDIFAQAGIARMRYVL